MRKSGPPKGLISYLVLELLAERPRYGYELLGEITEISGGHWEPSYGSVYPILYKFEEDGVTERIEREDEPDRKYFKLTDEGRETLAEKRAEIGSQAHDFADVVLGFYHLYAALTTDDRFAVDDTAGDWRYDERHSAWIVEQMIRHHERDFGEFERITDSVEEFHAATEEASVETTDVEEDRDGTTDDEAPDDPAAGTSDADERETTSGSAD